MRIIIVHEQAVNQLTKLLDDLAEELALKSRTGKLWIEYLNSFCYLSVLSALAI